MKRSKNYFVTLLVGLVGIVSLGIILYSMYQVTISAKIDNVSREEAFQDISMANLVNTLKKNKLVRDVSVDRAHPIQVNVMLEDSSSLLLEAYEEHLRDLIDNALRLSDIEYSYIVN